jgi:hypothetical protein
MLVEKSLDFIESQLNAYLKLKSGVQNDRVAASGVVRQNGSLEIPNNHVGITLVNIEEETHAKTQGKQPVNNGSTTARGNPDIKINIYLLFTANFSEYGESLKAVSQVLSFFQGRNVFHKSQYPSLDPSIDRLVFELQSLSFEQLNHLWGTIGAKYMPSILYKMRMLVIQEGEPDAMSYPLREIRIHGTGRS